MCRCIEKTYVESYAHYMFSPGELAQDESLV